MFHLVTSSSNDFSMAGSRYLAGIRYLVGITVASVEKKLAPPLGGPWSFFSGLARMLRPRGVFLVDFWSFYSRLSQFYSSISSISGFPQGFIRYSCILGSPLRPPKGPFRPPRGSI